MASQTQTQVPTPTDAGRVVGGIFSSSRSLPFPSIFPAHPTPVTWDVLYMGILSGFIVLMIAYLSIILAFREFSEKMRVTARVTIGLSLGLIIMACNFGQEWEVGHIRTNTAYRAGTGQTIKADLGVSLSLRSVNITLKAVEPPHGDLAGEKIDYNERFSWAWGQGNPGFGIFAGPIQRAFRAAQVRGIPLPILWVAEYFTIDGEGVRFGRHYRHAGWYAHICVWTAFPLWILTLILFKMVVKHGAETLTLTGIMLFCAALIWALNRNPTELQIPFEDAILTTHFGIHWYLSLITGVVCIVAGVTIYLLDQFFPGKLSAVFGNNPLSIVELETGEEEEEDTKVTGRYDRGRRMSMQSAGRRVVTTIRLRGHKSSLTKVTHNPQLGDWTGRQSSQSLASMDGEGDKPKDEAGSPTDLQPSTPGKPRAVSFKDGQVEISVDPEAGPSSGKGHENPVYQDGGDEEINESDLKDQSWI